MLLLLMHFLIYLTIIFPFAGHQTAATAVSDIFFSDGRVSVSICLFCYGEMTELEWIYFNARNISIGCVVSLDLIVKRLGMKILRIGLVCCEIFL